MVAKERILTSARKNATEKRKLFSSIARFLLRLERINITCVCSKSNRRDKCPQVQAYASGRVFIRCTHTQLS